MRNAFFIKRFLERGLMVVGLVLGLLVIGAPQALAQSPFERTPQVTNLLCAINAAAGFEVVAISSTDQCVLNEVGPQKDCAEALQFIMGSRRFGIDSGGGGVSQGISEALVTTAGGVVYTLTRLPATGRGGRLPECVD